MQNFKRIYWILIAMAFFALAMMNIYWVDLTQYAVFFNLIASFFFFALFFLTKAPKIEDENHKDLDKNKQ